METLLRAKHWQVFLFAFGIPWLLMLIIMGFGFGDLFSMIKANPDPEDMAIVMSDFMTTMMTGILPITILSTAVVYAWMYAVNQRIAPMAPEMYRPNRNYVTWAIGAIVAFTFLNAIITYYMYGSMFDGLNDLENYEDDFGLMGTNFVLLNTLSILTSFANFGLLIYVSYQLSRAIKGAEEQRHLTSGETIGPFFAFFFLFVGIWFIQPVVNKLHEEGPGGRNSLDNSLLLD